MSPGAKFDVVFLRSASVMHEILRWAASIGTIGAGLVLAARRYRRISRPTSERKPTGR